MENVDLDFPAQHGVEHVFLGGPGKFAFPPSQHQRTFPGFDEGGAGAGRGRIGEGLPRQGHRQDKDQISHKHLLDLPSTIE
jgi:hypothetical protein